MIDTGSTSGIPPRRAPVRPRVVWPETGDAIPLEEAVLPLERKAPRAIEIVGRPGSGKTTALAHLAAVLPEDHGVVLLDEPTPEQAASEAAVRPVVYTTTTPHVAVAAESLYLTSWRDDELIEYLLAVHPAECGSVMARVAGAGNRRRLAGIPQLWTAVLDQMAQDLSLTDIGEALRRQVRSVMPDEAALQWTRDFSLALLAGPEALSEAVVRHLAPTALGAGAWSLVRHRLVQALLAADQLAELLRSGGECTCLRNRLGRDLVEETAAWIAASQPALDRLRRLVDCDDPSYGAMAASLLHAAGSGWKPGRKPPPCLDGAYLSGASWPEIDLSEAHLAGADLGGANLIGAKLDRAVAADANLRHAALCRASLERLDARGAYFSLASLSQARGRAADFHHAALREADLEGAVLWNADFRQADLSGARFRGADLQHARLAGATIDGADFTGANLRWASLRGLNLQAAVLSGACLAEADLTSCNLEHVRLPEANLQGAYLVGAYLTGSWMPRANFQGARLRRAGLADVHWEGADLRNADMQGCSFHLGSSRSGLVGSPIASEGTRTGFYTDEYHEQHYRRPEEIRKADLRRADLRGAKIDGVDFYLVDLRGALSTTEQFDQFRRCGAILYDW